MRIAFLCIVSSFSLLVLEIFSSSGAAYVSEALSMVLYMCSRICCESCDFSRERNCRVLVIGCVRVIMFAMCCVRFSLSVI